MRDVDYFVAAEQVGDDDDPLLGVRRAICRRVTAVPSWSPCADPERDRDPADYQRRHGGVAPGTRPGPRRTSRCSLEPTATRRSWCGATRRSTTPRSGSSSGRGARCGRRRVDVVPGIARPQLLAARHRIVLHEVGQPVHVTTGRRLPRGGRRRAGQHRGDAQPRSLDARRARRLVDLVGRQPRHRRARSWSPAGSATCCADDRARAAARPARRAGWVMDVYLLAERPS